MALSQEINWQHIFERCGGMGWTPDRILASSLPQILMCFRGWQRANGVDPDIPAAKVNEPMSISEAEGLFAAHTNSIKMKGGDDG